MNETETEVVREKELGTHPAMSWDELLENMGFRKVFQTDVPWPEMTPERDAYNVLPYAQVWAWVGRTPEEDEYFILSRATAGGSFIEAPPRIVFRTDWEMGEWVEAAIEKAARRRLYQRAIPFGHNDVAKAVGELSELIG